jgi:serine/threonine-protein kinase PpkA
MAIKYLIICVILSTFATTATAQDCAPEVASFEIEAAQLYQEIDLRRGRLVARANFAEFESAALPEAVRATLTEAPVAPELPEGFDEGRPVIDCSAADGGSGQVDALRRAIEEASAALDRYEAEIGERVAAIEAAPSTAPSEAVEPPTATAPETTPPGSEPPVAAAPEDIEPDADGSAEPVPGDAPEVADAEPETGSATPEAGRMPLAVAEAPSQSQRVITLPGAELTDAAGRADGGRPLPVFSVLYVFDRTEVAGQPWVEVSQALDGSGSGWILADRTLDWSTMLVMQFAPAGRRSPVLFFNDDIRLADMVTSPFYEQDAAEIYDRLAEERARLAEDPSHVAQWDSSLVAMEPETAVTFANDPYILPILDWREESFDNRYDTVLLQVAAVPAEAEDLPERDERGFTQSAEESAARGGPLRLGVVFVLDTTTSMQPFIDRTYETVEAFYRAFGQLETSELVSFGLVGFRDNTDINPEGIGYVTRVFQPLDVEAPAEQVLVNARSMAASDVPTEGFAEDGFAGIKAAIDGMDWTPFNARLIVYVTDASAREGADPRAAEPALTPESLVESARAANVAIIPIHLDTPLGRRTEDVARAERQYRTLSGTGDPTLPKYIRVDAEADEAFASALDTMTRQLVRSLLRANSGQAADPDTDPSLEGLETGGAPQDPEGQIAAAIAGEIFRAQLESLATVDGGDAPAFLSGWAADRDLSDPETTSLEVKVFLTRNQLSTLDRQLDAIVSAYNEGGSPSEFFDRLQLLAAQTSTDPNAAPVVDDRDMIRSLLPDFLSRLPYRSEVLRLDREFWEAESEPKRRQFIERIVSKQRVYADIFTNVEIWQDFGSGDPGQQATPIRLVNLP